MSGGGAGAEGGLPTYLQIDHSLILSGEYDKDAPTNDMHWGTVVYSPSGDTYKDNPSVLRYIWRYGLTDVGGNPYEGVSSYDPDDDLDVIQEEFDGFKEALEVVDPSADVPAFRGVAEGAIAELNVNDILELALNTARRGSYMTLMQAFDITSIAGRDGVIEKAMRGFRARARKEHFTAVNRFAGPMSEAGAVNSSAFVVGMALLESGYEDRMAQHDGEFTLQLTRDSFGMFVQTFTNVLQLHLNGVLNARLQESRQVDAATQQILELSRFKTEMMKDSTTLQGEISRQKIVAKGEQYDKDLEYDVKSMHWDLELFQQAGNIMSAVQGSVVPGAGKPNRVQSALGGTLGGVSAGAMVGSKIAPGPVGAAIGAGVGGVVGLVGGLLGG